MRASTLKEVAPLAHHGCELPEPMSTNTNPMRQEEQARNLPVRIQHLRLCICVCGVCLTVIESSQVVASHHLLQVVSALPGLEASKLEHAGGLLLIQHAAALASHHPAAASRGTQRPGGEATQPVRQAQHTAMGHPVQSVTGAAQPSVCYGITQHSTPAVDVHVPQHLTTPALYLLQPDQVPPMHQCAHGPAVG